MKATKVTAGVAENNGVLPPDGSLSLVTRGLTACTLGSAPGPTPGNEYGKTYLFTFAIQILKATVTVSLWQPVSP